MQHELRPLQAVLRAHLLQQRPVRAGRVEQQLLHDLHQLLRRHLGGGQVLQLLLTAVEVGLGRQLQLDSMLSQSCLIIYAQR